MAEFSSDRLLHALKASLPSAASGELLIAFSGGLDSTVLLNALNEVAARDHLRVVHIDHRLHAVSDRWREHCESVAHAANIPFIARQVDVAGDDEEGVESAARRARYEALRALLRPGETLLTAQHADDQLETVLFALVRGSGVDGLAAMPRLRRFGPGWHLRPFLEFTRAELAAWAAHRNLSWLEDPSNQNTRFDRNYLRREVVPTLTARWPSAARSASRSAAHLGEAAGLLDAVAAHDLAVVAIDTCLRVSSLAALDEARRRNLLRYWISSRGARAPSTRKLIALEHDMLFAQSDRWPCVAWDGFEMRRHRGLLYCGPALADAQFDLDWDWRQSLDLGSLGQLRAEIVHGTGLARARLPSTLRLRTRAGGERLKRPGHEHRQALKKLLQDANILPWWRSRLPLLFHGRKLIAVADLWIDDEFAASPDEEGVQLHWDGKPRIEGISDVQ